MKLFIVLLMLFSMNSYSKSGKVPGKAHITFNKHSTVIKREQTDKYRIKK